MSLSQILGSAVSGLSAAQAGLRTVSNNIANVSTPGYARERVSLSTGVTQGRVSGVVIGEPSRIADRFLEQSVYLRSGDVGRTEVTANYLDRLQALLGEPGAEAGLPARLDAIAASAISMTGAQRSEQTSAAFIADVQDAISTFRQLEGDVAVLRGDVESEVGFSVDQVNGLLQRIHTLNDTVSQQKGLGRSSAGAEGQRMTAIEELSGMLNITTRMQPDGRINIDAPNGTVLVDSRLRQLSYPIAGDGVDQPTYPVIDIRYANDAGQPGAATGQKLDSASIGGKLGGLLDLRDRALPDFSDQLGQLFGGVAETLNAVSNAGTAYPPPNQLEGRPTGLDASDRLGFTGKAVFAVTDKQGTIVARTEVDFDALSAGATLDDAIGAINSGLGGNATASLKNGSLVIAAADSTNGVAVAQGTPPSARAGNGFSHYFGLNDLVRSENAVLVPSGFVPGDPHGFGAGETAELVLRDAAGRTLGSATVTGGLGPQFGDLVDELNQSSLGAFGSFAMDDRGRFAFTPNASVAGTSLSVPSDSTSRHGTGVSFTMLSGLTGGGNGLSTAGVRNEMLADPRRLPLGQLNPDASPGQVGLGSGDTRSAAGFVAALGDTVDFGKGGFASIERFSSLLIGGAGSDAARVKDALADASARRDDAVARRDGFAGVNLDEELSQMVVLQNSYSAAARIMTTASKMYEELIEMIR